MKVKLIVTCAIFIISFSAGYSQDYRENKTKEYITWTLMQIVPSPTFFQDTDGKNSRIQFGFKWQITPINISFKTNKYVSRFQFFMINPVRRFTGSVEAFIQPEIATAEFKYSNIKSAGISGGTRLVIPISEYGENLCGSIGMKYTYRKDNTEINSNYTGLEAGLYFFGGILGLQYTQNFNSRTNFNISFFIKYF